MKKQKGRVGGFAALNSGNIKNCYSVVTVKTGKQSAGGFAGENNGTIAKSYAYNKIKKLTGGFAASGSGHSEDSCYFLHKEKQGSKKLKKLVDAEIGIRQTELKDEDTVSRLGFDMQQIWELQQEKDVEIPIRFIPENWLYEITESSLYQQCMEMGKETVIIKNADELQEWAKRVNEGDKEAAEAYIKLEEDIDLGGKEWIPIGIQHTSAFSGIFDGCGHLIKNFVIKDKKTEQKGFFGILKGEVYNVTVDCHIKGGLCTGGLAAQNEGIIGCCAAIVSIKNTSGHAGGLVGSNAGTIVQSYAAGKISIIAVPWWLAIPILAIILLLLFIKPADLLPNFAPVPYDEDAVPSDEKVNPNTDGNFVSFQFEQKVTVDLATGKCKLNFRNPGNSNHNIVVQLQFTDAQATRIMGSTGRSESEQKKLEENPSYDPETYRMILAESGSIRPGYQLEDLKLTEQANGATLPPGDYNAVVYLVFYDIVTNNRAMLESQLPVVITVQ